MSLHLYMDPDMKPPASVPACNDCRLLAFLLRVCVSLSLCLPLSVCACVRLSLVQLPMSAVLLAACACFWDAAGLDPISMLRAVCWACAS